MKSLLGGLWSFFSARSFILRSASVGVEMRGFRALVAEPECDYRKIDTGLQEMHGPERWSSSVRASRSGPKHAGAQLRDHPWSVKKIFDHRDSPFGPDLAAESRTLWSSAMPHGRSCHFVEGP